MIRHLTPTIRFQAADPRSSIPTEVLEPVKARLNALPGGQTALQTLGQKPDSFEGSVQVIPMYRTEFSNSQEKYTVDLEPDGSIIRAFKRMGPADAQQQFRRPVVPNAAIRQGLTDYLKAFARYMHDPDEVSSPASPGN